MTTALSHDTRPYAFIARRPAIVRAEAQLRAGRPIIVRDGTGADLVFAAQFATSQLVADLVHHTGGYVCAAMPIEHTEDLGLPLQYRTAPPPGMPRYCVSVDATEAISTGISAHDRATTLQLLASPDTAPEQLCRGGHVMPVAVDLLRIDRARGAQLRFTTAVLLAESAGLHPVVAASTLPDDDDRRLGACSWRDDTLLRQRLVEVSVGEVLARLL